MTKINRRMCNICKEYMTGGIAGFRKHGEDRHPGHYLLEAPSRIVFSPKNYWCPIDNQWYSDRRWMARTLRRSGITNEQYYLHYGQDFLPKEWNDNTSDPVLGDARNKDNCLQCSKKVKFNESKWHYPAFCGFKCSTSWYATNTDRVSKAMTTIAEKKKVDPTFLLSTSSTGYWVLRGHTIEEARQKVKERQTTNSLEAFIKRAGGDVEEGTRKWSERQEKWLNSLEKRGWFGNHSEVSKKLFTQLKEITGLDLRFGDQEMSAKVGDRVFKLDCTVHGTKKAIEFFGDYWHASPTKYKETDAVRRLNEGSLVSAKEIWDRDSARLKLLRDHGFDVMVVWENEYVNDEENTLKKCANFFLS